MLRHGASQQRGSWLRDLGGWDRPVGSPRRGRGRRPSWIANGLTKGDEAVEPTTRAGAIGAKRPSWAQCAPVGGAIQGFVVEGIVSEKKEGCNGEEGVGDGREWALRERGAKPSQKKRCNLFKKNAKTPQMPRSLGGK